MTFRNWRYSAEQLQEIVEKTPAALEQFNKALRSIPQMAGLKEPIETAVESMRDMSQDLLAAREYLKDADALAERLQARVEKLESMTNTVHVINNQAPAPAMHHPAGPPEPMCGTVAPPIDSGNVGGEIAGNLN